MTAENTRENENTQNEIAQMVNAQEKVNAPEMGLWLRLAGIITRPGATLAAVVEKPTVLWPALVISLVNLVMFVVTIPKLQQYLAWSYENMPKQGMTPEQLAQMKSAMSVAGLVGGGVTMLLLPFLIWLVLSLAFKFLNLFIGNEAPLKKLYAVSVITSIPIIIGSTLRYLLVLVSPGESYATVTTSAAAVMPRGSVGPLFALLSCIDPFIIWSLVLLALGGALVLKTSVRKTGVLVFIMWMLMAAVSIAFTMFNAQQLPGA